MDLRLFEKSLKYGTKLIQYSSTEMFQNKNVSNSLKKYANFETVSSSISHIPNAMRAYSTTRPLTMPEFHANYSKYTKDLSKVILPQYLKNDIYRAKITISPEKQQKLISTVTTNPEEQKLLLKMINNETIVVDKLSESAVMRRQFREFLTKNPNITRENIYIYSPRPKGQVKSYTTSGEAFASANNIDKAHIKTSFAEIPENATVFMPDDCSITGASMVFDLLEQLPANFKGKIVYAPTVIGKGKNLAGEVMANEVLSMMKKATQPNADKKAIVEELKVLISDGKKTNIEALDNFANPEAFKNVKIDVASGSLEARSFRETDTFKSLTSREQRLVDSLFTAGRLNTGYHASGTMVFLPTKTPNNNVGIMEIFAKEMGLKTKPDGIISFSENLALKSKGKKCALGLVPDCNNRGVSKELILEIEDGSRRSARIPYNAKDEKPIDVVVKLNDGSTQTVKYLPKKEVKTPIEEKLISETERLYGLEVAEGESGMQALKGLYRPKSMKQDMGYYVDVLAIPKDAEIISVGDVAMADLFKTIK